MESIRRLCALCFLAVGLIFPAAATADTYDMLINAGNGTGAHSAGMKWTIDGVPGQGFVYKQPF